MANGNQPAINQKDLTDKLLNRIGEMKGDGLALPQNYNASNALNVAFLELIDMKVKEQPLLEKVTKKSVYQSLLNMVLQGLTPAKNQVYFIPYGNELQMQRSYFGTQTALKRLSGVHDVWANVIFEADDFDMKIDEKGRERLAKHDTNFMNRDGAIVGAYAIIDTEHDGQLLTVMTKKEIDASWSQAKTSNVHSKFPQEMAKRTVISRAAKNYINTSDDSDMYIQAINETTEAEYDNDRRDVTDKSEKSDDLLSEFNGEATEHHEEQQEDEPIEVDFEEVNEYSDDAQDMMKQAQEKAARKDVEDEQGELFEGRTINPNGQ